MYNKVLVYISLKNAYTDRLTDRQTDILPRTSIKMYIKTLKRIHIQGNLRRQALYINFSIDLILKKHEIRHHEYTSIYVNSTMSDVNM